jgi:hypothetical protein
MLTRPPLCLDFLTQLGYNTIMVTFSQKAAFADKVFGSFLLDVYFDEFSGEGNVMIASRKEVGEYLLNSIRAMATDIGANLEHPDDFSVVASGMNDLIEDLNKLHNLPEDIEIFVFHDGRVFK